MKYLALLAIFCSSVASAECLFEGKPLQQGDIIFLDMGPGVFAHSDAPMKFLSCEGQTVNYTWLINNQKGQVHTSKVLAVTRSLELVQYCKSRPSRQRVLTFSTEKMFGEKQFDFNSATFVPDSHDPEFGKCVKQGFVCTVHSASIKYHATAKDRKEHWEMCRGMGLSRSECFVSGSNAKSSWRKTERRVFGHKPDRQKVSEYLAANPGVCPAVNFCAKANKGSWYGGVEKRLLGCQ